VTETSIPQRMAAYIDASPTPYHCVANTAAMLDRAGFAEIDLAAEPVQLPAGFEGYVKEEGSIVAFRVGSEPANEAGFRIVAAHTDSPNLRLKPQPIVFSHGYIRLGVEVYGGVLVATWADRDLGLAGKVVLRDGQGLRSELVNLNRPLCRIPNLAIHLNRTANDKGLLLDKQRHLPAVLALGEKGEDPLRALLAEELDVDVEAILTFDLMLYDLTPATVSGAGGEFFHSARLDNQASCHAALEALLSNGAGKATAVVALFDHEEVGSNSARGADSRILDNVLERVAEHSVAQAPGSLSRALSNSWLVSCDMAHAVHPAYADKHDGNHLPKLNAGPVIKQNANQRYSTEAETSARFVLLCEAVDSPYQWFVNRSDLRCGSTVGPMLSSRLGVRGVDVGNPMLSMHSAREMCGTQDQLHMIRVLAAFLAD
jgi:aspartyl aminopeptidase